MECMSLVRYPDIADTGMLALWMSEYLGKKEISFSADSNGCSKVIFQLRHAPPKYITRYIDLLNTLPKCITVHAAESTGGFFRKTWSPANLNTSTIPLRPFSTRDQLNEILDELLSVT